VPPPPPSVTLRKLQADPQKSSSSSSWGDENDWTRSAYEPAGMGFGSGTTIWVEEKLEGVRLKLPRRTFGADATPKSLPAMTRFGPFTRASVIVGYHPNGSPVASAVPLVTRPIPSNAIAHTT
jgi:hypothetical protein